MLNIQCPFSLTGGLLGLTNVIPSVIIPSGESALVPTSIHDEIKPIQAICDQYQPEDIYNMDETGLYWRRMPNGDLSTDGYAGQKRDKARITIFRRMLLVRTKCIYG
jgi:hypothetical protein